MPKKTPRRPDLAELLPSWELFLRTGRKSPQTVKSYGDGVRSFLRWAARTGQPAVLTKEALGAFTLDALEINSPATALSRHVSIRRFSAWLLAEGEIYTDEIAGVEPPKLDEVIVDPLTDGEIKAMIQACQGPLLSDKRDEAIIRLMVESAARSSEIINMTVSDMSVPDGTAVIRRGKGGKGRIVPFSPHTARAIDRYLRGRRTHRLADSDALWLGERGKTFSYNGLYQSLARRAVVAGVEGFHPHRLRHTGADRWLAAGGSEGGLMAVAGWESTEMMRRYTKRRSAVRAIEESRRLNLGDF